MTRLARLAVTVAVSLLIAAVGLLLVRDVEWARLAVGYAAFVAGIAVASTVLLGLMVYGGVQLHQRELRSGGADPASDDTDAS